MSYFWVVALCRLRGDYRRFGGTWCIRFQGTSLKWKCVHPKLGYPPTRPHGVITWRTHSVNAHCCENLKSFSTYKTISLCNVRLP
jgi:hypothetical protein